MKRFIASLFLSVGLIAPAQANGALEYCIMLSDLAYLASMERQEGGGASDMIQVANISEVDPVTRDLIIFVIKEAFKIPVQRHPKAQEEASQDFAAQIAFVCLETFLEE